VGWDPFEIERHVAVLRYYASGMPYRGSAGIDIALWDLIGKVCGQPLFKLWGGGKEKVPAYASMIRLSAPEERAELATRLADEGWRAIKLRKVGVMAEAFGKRVIPHHGGGHLGTVAHLHLIASWAHSPYLELLHDPPIGDYRHGFSIFEEPPRVDEDGCVSLPEGPGLGVEIKEDLVEG